MQKILQVVIYPLDNPRHGGQIRCNEIRNAVMSEGLEVTTFTILTPGLSTSIGPSITLPTGTKDPLYFSEIAELAPLTTDLFMHYWLLSPEGQQKLKSAVPNDAFQFVIFEQPWAFKALIPILQAHNPDIEIIYSSHNHEAALKELILEKYSTSNVENQIREKIKSEIDELERFATQMADEIWVVKLQDALDIDPELIKKTIVLPNGTRKISLNSARPSPDMEGFALFIGSAYPPNFFGFIELIGEDLFFLPPQFKIFCVGGVAAMIRQWATNSPFSRHLLSRLVFIEDASNHDLEILLAQARLLILPIVTGGGSNLKTAEALASGNQIVGTTASFRGFETWIGTEGVLIADTKETFRASIGRLASLGSKVGRVVRTSSLESPLYWPECLTRISSGLLGKENRR